MGASNGEIFPQQGPPGLGDSSGENVQQRGPLGRRASGSRDSIMHVVCFDQTSRTLTALAREALVILIIENCKWKHLHGAEEMRVEERTEYTVRKSGEPRLEDRARIVVAITTRLINSPELNNHPLKEGLLERMGGMARKDEYTQ